MSAVVEGEPNGRLAGLVRRVRESRERVNLTAEHGGEVVMIAREELDELDELERLEDEADQAEFDRAEAEDDGVRIPLEEIAARLGVPS